jgi:hypothetical protein
MNTTFLSDPAVSFLDDYFGNDVLTIVDRISMDCDDSPNKEAPDQVMADAIAELRKVRNLRNAEEWRAEFASKLPDLGSTYNNATVADLDQALTTNHRRVLLINRLVSTINTTDSLQEWKRAMNAIFRVGRYVIEDEKIFKPYPQAAIEKTSVTIPITPSP